MKRSFAMVSMALMFIAASAMLVQAASKSGDETGNPGSDTRTLVSDGLLTPASSTQNVQASGKPNKNDSDGFPGDNGNANGCKNGKAKGNKHCVPSPSE